MAELSSLLFVDTDELGRPTGLIASEENDTFASALMPQDVKDTVDVVRDADVSGSYEGWNTVSGVSALAEVSGELLALPTDFTNLEGSVAEISAAVEPFDPDTVLNVSATVFNNSGTWEDSYTYVFDASDNLADTSSLVIGSESTLSSLAVSTSDLSTAIDNIPIGGQVPADVSNNWQNTYIYSTNASGDISATSSLTLGLEASTSQLSTTIDNLPIGGQVPADVSNNWQQTYLFNQESSGLVEDGSGVLSSLSGFMPGNVGAEPVFIGGDLQPRGEGAPGPDVPYASALPGLASLLRVIDPITDFDKDATLGDGDVAIQLSGLRSIRTERDKSLAISQTDLSGNEVARIRLQNTPSALAYMSASVVGLVATEDIRIGFSSLDLLPGNASSLKSLFIDTQDNSGGWQDSYGYVGDASGKIKDVSTYVLTTSDNLGDVSNYVSDASGNISDVSVVVVDGSNIIGDLSGENKQLSAGTLTLLGGNEITFGAEAGSTSSLLPIISDLASVSGEGGGGSDSREASALLIGGGVYAQINGNAATNQILVYNGTNFVYRNQALPSAGDPGTPLGQNFTAPSGDSIYNFGPSATIKGGETLDFSGSFTSSGLTKTLLEFDDKSRFALGRNSVPLEISALGESDVRLEDDGTSGAFVLLKGSTPSEGEPSRTRMHFQHADLSADADSQIDFDTDINLGAAAHLNGNTLGSIHIACKNTQGASVSGGTPVYITGNVGGSNKIEIGVASASVASSMPAVGILSEDLADNAEGYVDAFGIASKLNTSAFAFGDTLYVAPTGGLTNVRPTATTDLVQNIGIVELSDASNGKIIVLGPGRTNDIPNSIDSSSVSGLGALALLDTVDTAQIDDDAITQAKIAFQAVDSSEIAPDAIIASKIADGNITGVKLGASSVSETKIATDAVTGSKIQDGAVTETKIATDAITASKIRSGAVGNDEIASNAVGTDELVNGAVTAAKVSSDILTTGSSSQTKSGDLTVKTLKADQSIDTASWTYGDPSAVNEMPVMQGFTVKPKGYGDNGKGIEFRYDTLQTGYILDEESGATYNIIEGSDPGSTRVKNFTKYTSQYTNLNTYKSGASAFEIEFSGFSISNSSNTSWKPLVLFHGGGTAASSITVQALEGDGTTWTTVFSGSLTGQEQTDVIFPENYYTISTGNLRGMRLRFEGISNNIYLKMFGFTSRTSPSFAWQMLKDGGSFYGDIDGKLNGVQEWYIQQDGDTSFKTVAIDGSQVINNSGDWVGNNLDHTTDLDNVGTNTHAQIDAQLASLGALATLDTVDTAQIDDSAVTADKINGGAVTTVKIGDSQVTNSKINNGAVTDTKISSGAVTTDKIAAGAVTESRIDEDFVADLIQDGDLIQPFATTYAQASAGYEMPKIVFNDVVTDRFYGRPTEVSGIRDSSAGTTYLNATEIEDLFDGNYDSSYQISRTTDSDYGSPITLTLDLSANGLVTSNGFTYAAGYFYVYTYAGRSILDLSGRVKDKNGTYTNISNITAISQYGGNAGSAWKLQCPIGNWLTALELTMTPHPGTEIWLSNITYHGSRSGTTQGPLVTCFGGKYFGDIEGYRAGVREWRVTQGGYAEFDSVNINGTNVITAGGDWAGNNLDHTTDLDNVGTNTHAQIDSKLSDLGSVSGNIATNTTNITNLTTSSSELSAAIDAKVTLSEGNQTITGNRTVDDGNNGYFYLLDMEDTGKKSQVFLNPANPSVQIVANDTVGGNITGFTAGSTNLNLQFTGSADLRVNNAPGTTGQVLTSNGTGSAPSWQAAGGGGGGTTVELLSAGFSGTGSIPTAVGSLLTWDAPGLNTASVTYAAGEFTIPAGINGYYCEVNAMAGGDTGSARVELNFELQKDTGGGYSTVAAGDNYVVRTTTQDEGGVWINFLDPTAVATGDKYKFTLRRVGGGLNHKPTATKLTMKFYSP